MFRTLFLLLEVPFVAVAVRSYVAGLLAEVANDLIGIPPWWRLLLVSVTIIRLRLPGSGIVIVCIILTIIGILQILGILWGCLVIMWIPLVGVLGVAMLLIVRVLVLSAVWAWRGGYLLDSWFWLRFCGVDLSRFVRRDVINFFHRRAEVGFGFYKPSSL